MDYIKEEIFEFDAFLEFASNVDPRLSAGVMLFYLHPSRNIYSLSLTEKFITFYQNRLENMLEKRFFKLHHLYPSFQMHLSSSEYNIDILYCAVEYQLCQYSRWNVHLNMKRELCETNFRHEHRRLGTSWSY